MSHIRVSIGLILLAAIALAPGCASPPAQAQALTKVRIGKPQAATFPFVPVDVGIATGIFKKHGLDVESINFAGGPRVQQAITADAVDIAIGSGPEMALILKGVPEIAIAAMADAPYAIVLAVLKDGPKSVSELKGKTVSISSAGSLTDWLGQNLSRQQGWGIDGIKLAALGTTAAQTAALKTHQIDGMIVEANGGYRLEEDGSGRVLVQFGDLMKTVSRLSSSMRGAASRSRIPTPCGRSWPPGSRPSTTCTSTGARPSTSCGAPPTCRPSSPPATMTP